MRRAWAAACLAACAAALLAAPGAASGEGFRIASVPRTSVRISLPGSNGYRISIRTFPGDLVQLTAAGDDVSATYLVRGRVGGRGLDADFGPLGRVSVRLPDPVSPPERSAPRGCRGRRPLREVGSFQGTIEFHGELGFTSVSAKSARGSLVRTFRLACGDRAARPRRTSAGSARTSAVPSLFARTLVAVARSGGRTVFLEDEELGRGASHLVIAGTDERLGRVSIERRALIEADRATLSTSAPSAEPETATLTLPEPFAGTGSYLAAPGAPPIWSGDLSVSLPGAGRLPLSGPGFRALLCQGRTGDPRMRRCLRVADDLVP